MGLIARSIEAAGIPTLSMTSALSITRSVAAPRAAFLDYPLGHTTGKPGDPALQRNILRDAFAAFERLGEPGDVLTLDYAWAENDDWKDAVMRPRTTADRDAAAVDDDRAPRSDTPQYQCAQDRELAEQALAAGGCPTCVFLDG